MWERSAARIDLDLGTLKMAEAAELTSEEAEERNSVLRASWEDRVKLSHKKNRTVYGRRISRT